MQQTTEMIQAWLLGLGLPETVASLGFRLIVVTCVILVSLLADLIAKRLLLAAVRAYVKRSQNDWDDIFVKNRVFDRLSHLAPALVIYLGAPMMFPASDTLLELTKRLCLSYMILVTVLVFYALTNAIHAIYKKYPVSQVRPIRTYLQVVKIFAFLLASILILATIMNRSPWVFLSGLGALTAVLMLVFKDSILGFVASIQLSIHNMVRPGDWIEMKKYGADGDVIDVSINTVKVQNWDKTISTIPTYALIADSFKNWRGMSESGGRRIKRSISIDMSSVKFCDETMISKFKKIERIREYLETKGQELDAFNKEHGIDPSVTVNGRRLTNIGTFRAYLREYLRHHPKIHQTMTLLVRHLPPTEKGLPIEIYCFSNDQNWSNYEDLQADIFDHILAVLPEFELRTYQYPSGQDLTATR